MGETLVVPTLNNEADALIWMVCASVAIVLLNLLWNESDDDDDLSGGMMVPSYEGSSNN